MDRYLILILAGDNIFFLGKHGEHTSSIIEAMKFEEALDAKIYTDKHGLEKITCIRKIHFQ